MGAARASASAPDAIAAAAHLEETWAPMLLWLIVSHPAVHAPSARHILHPRAPGHGPTLDGAAHLPLLRSNDGIYLRRGAAV